MSFLAVTANIRHRGFCELADILTIFKTQDGAEILSRLPMVLRSEGQRGETFHEQPLMAIP